MRLTRLRIAMTVAAVLSGLAVVPSSRADVGPPSTSFTFGAAGDMGGGQNAASTLTALGGSGVDFYLHLGDRSYDNVTPESAWCDFVKSKVGSTLPYEIVSGEHDAGGRFSNSNQLIGDFASCMPDRMSSTGTYGKQYYFDYPPSAPLARVIMITPGLSLYAPKAFAPYTKGSANYLWVQTAIDSARAAGIRWVIVGMAFNCITAGVNPCQMGVDLQDLLVAEKVDLVLQGHEHGYERSKQLALGPSCPAVAVGSFRSGCVVNDGAHGDYAKGAGPVIVIAGTAGTALRPMNPKDSEAPYFVKLMGRNMQPTYGFMKYTVSATQLSAQFVRATGGGFTDSFVISGGSPVASPGAPVPTPAAVSAAPAAPASPMPAPSGYRLLGADGVVYPFGDATFLGDASSTLAPDDDAVHLEPTPDSKGYWILDRRGHVYPFGDASVWGSVDPSQLSPGEEAASLSATPTGQGYWIFTNRGRVLTYGDAVRYGDMSAVKLNGPVLDSVPTTSGKGYYMIASDGGIFAFGDATFRGSMGGRQLNAPVRSLVPDADGTGYWLVASDGGIFAFGAPFKGSMGGTQLNKPVTGMVRYADGYLMVGEDGGIFDFSDQPFTGSLGDHPPPRPIVSVATLNAPSPAG